MRSSRGSILAITLGFALVFTMLGTASIYMSTLQSETQEKQILSQQAFWLAEAGISKAIALLPSILPFDSVPGEFDNGKSYSVPSINPVTGTTDQWTIDSIGTVLGQSRHIRVTVLRADLNMFNVITCGGTFKPVGNSVIQGTVASGINPLIFLDIFGVDITEIYKHSDYIYNPAVNNQMPVKGITWVGKPPSELPGGVFHITSGGDWSGSGLLIVNGDVKMDGGTFDGVIWVIGNFDNANAKPGTSINGAVFIQGTEQFKPNGNISISFDSGAIEDAATIITSWQEIV